MNEWCGGNQEHDRAGGDPSGNTQPLLDLWSKANPGLIPHGQMLISGTQDDCSVMRRDFHTSLLRFEIIGLSFQ